MTEWSDFILRDFPSKVSRLTLVLDPDGLLLDEKILNTLEERGYEIIIYEDPVMFRFVYESRFRNYWENGEEKYIIVVVRTNEHRLNDLPYDIIQSSRKVVLSLFDLFPNLNSCVVEELGREHFDHLYTVYSDCLPERLGENATKDFILCNIFGLVPDQIKNSSDLLRTLLRIHYKNISIPKIFNDRFIQLLKKQVVFDDWPLELIVPKREAFFEFCQERWPYYLETLANAKDHIDTQTEKVKDNLKFPGHVSLPFNDDDIRVYIDNLFIEGILKPVAFDKASILNDSWVSVGITIDQQKDESERMKKLLELVESRLPAIDAKHNDWMDYAVKWAELKVLSTECEQEQKTEDLEKIQELISKIDSAFTTWMLRKYSSIINLPSNPPIMLHHVPRYLSMLCEKKKKVALIIVDGLPIDQWKIIRNELEQQCQDISFQDETIFAWAPTVTSVSRQSAFSGKTPNFFPNSIYTTNKEMNLWKQFWSDQSISQNEILYMRGLGYDDLEEIENNLDTRVKVAGFIINTIDDMMHGMVLGMAGMHEQVRLWARNGYLARLIQLLISREFSIIITRTMEISKQQDADDHWKE